MNWIRKTLAVAMVGALTIGSLATRDISTAAAKTDISKKKLTMRVGDSQKLSLKKAKKSEAKKAKWKSSNKKVVKVKFKKKTAKATVTAVARGKAKITAKLNRKTYTCQVTVNAAIQNLVMLRNTYATYVGSAVGVLPAVVGNEKLDVSQLKYKSSDSSVAKVIGKEGCVQGLKAGKATITITNPVGKKLKATVQVYNSEEEATYVSDFYNKIKEDKLNELKQAGIEVNDGQQIAGVEKQIDDRYAMVEKFSDEYLKAVNNNGGKSVYTDNTPADDIACIRSVFDVAEATKRNTLTQDLKTYLEPLDNAKTVEDVMKFNSKIIAEGETGFWKTEFTAKEQDNEGSKSPGKTIYLKLECSPATIFERKSDYAQKGSEKYKSLTTYVEETLRLCGESEEDIAKNTPIILSFLETCSPEVTINDLQAMAAEKSWDDVYKYMNKKSINEFNFFLANVDNAYPDLLVRDTYRSLGVADNVKVSSDQLSNSWDPLIDIVKNASVDELRELLRFCFASNYTVYTESGYTAYINYSYSKYGLMDILSEKEVAERYRTQSVRFLRNNVGWDTAKEYSAKVLGDKTKQGLQNLIDRILAEYRTTISKCPWMSDTAKTGAIKKVDKMKSTVYYPDIDTYDLKNDLQTTGEGGTIFKNTHQIHNSNLKNLVSLIGRKLTSDEILWFNLYLGGINPMDVNAFYGRTTNRFIIFAGIVGEEVYKEGYDDYNLGRIGYAIGHEIGHAFDSNGSLYDENGEPNAWMTDSDLATYEEKKAVYVKYFDQFSAVYDKVNETIYYANGQFELKENMADISSIQIITQMMKKNNASKESMQKVFINMGLFWADAKPLEPTYLLMDEHGPNSIRGGFTFSLFDEFYDAFDIKEGDAMYVIPKYRVKLWS